MIYLYAFLVGGVICVIGQILLSLTKITSARILVLYVVLGVVLGVLGLYEPIVKFAGAGATVPLTGFGYTMAKGVSEAVRSDGLVGAFTGGIRAGAGGITAAVLFGYFFSVISNARTKK